MSSETILWLLFGFATKHFFIDFPLQVPFHYKNKGTYGHMGGIAHAGLHAMGTFVVFALAEVSFGMMLLLSLIDGILHYHIDWAKMNINRIKGWTATTHEEFWWLVGLDQYLHALTYIMLIWIAI